MKKLSRIIGGLILSISPILPMDSIDITDKDPKKVLCKTEVWENGKKISEKIEYVPDVQESPTQRSGMGAWESADWPMVRQPESSTIIFDNQAW